VGLSIECPRCRGRQFIRSEHPRRDEVVVCIDCGIRFHFGELEDLATKSVRILLAKTFPRMSL